MRRLLSNISVLLETALDWSAVCSKMVSTACKLHTRNQNGEEEGYRRSGSFDDGQWSTKNEEAEDQKGENSQNVVFSCFQLLY